jgi:hypothetical protein
LISVGSYRKSTDENRKGTKLDIEGCQALAALSLSSRWRRA